MSIVIVGAGEMGYQLARRLSYEKQDVVLIDRHSERVNFIQENLDVKAIVGRGSDPTILRQAGIEHAHMLVAVTDSDDVNIVACFVAGYLNKTLRKVARLRQEDYKDFPEILGKGNLDIDLVISPENEAVSKVLQVLQFPAATDAMDFAEGRIKLVGFKVLPNSPFLGHSLMNLRAKFPEERILIPAIFRDSEAIIPRGNDQLKSNDTVYVLAAADAIPRVIEMAGMKFDRPKRVMVLGGTAVGIKMCRELEALGVGSIKLIEADPARCEEIAGMLDRVMVLRVDPVDEDFLRSEGIGETDVFLSTSQDDEDNALKALLAKRLGAKRVAVLTNKVGYHRLLNAIGVDLIMNPRLAGASRILQYIRRGKVVSVSMLPGEGIEAIEYEAVEGIGPGRQATEKNAIPHRSHSRSAPTRTGISHTRRGNHCQARRPGRIFRT